MQRLGLVMILSYKTDNPGASSSTQVRLPLVASGTYAVTLTGRYSILRFGADGDAQKILDIKQWGKNKWSTMYQTFYNCTNLQITATDNPDLSLVTDVSFMFNGSAAFNGNIGSWDTSTVTNMRFMFNGAAAFNQNIGGWNTSVVTDMNFIFSEAATFNQDLSGWVVSQVTLANRIDFDLGATAWTAPNKPNFPP